MPRGRELGGEGRCGSARLTPAANPLHEAGRACDSMAVWNGSRRAYGAPPAAGSAMATNGSDIMKRTATVVLCIFTCSVIGHCAAAAAQEAATQAKPLEQCTPVELVQLGRQLRRAGESGRQDRAALVEYVGKRYLAEFQSGQLKWPDWVPLLIEVSADCSEELRGRFVGDIEKSLLLDKAALRSIPPATWRGVISKLLTGISAGKTQWAEQLYKAFVMDSQGLATLHGRRDIEALSAALGLLGDKRADTLPTAYMNTNGWQTWTAGDLEWLIGKLPSAGRQKAADQMLSRLLAARKSAGMSLEDWQRATGLVRPGLPPEQTSLLNEGLRNAFFGETGGFQKLDSQDCSRLTRALDVLGVQDASGLAVRFVLEKSSWKTWDPNGLSSLVSDVGTGKDEKAKAARALVFDHLRSKYLSCGAAVRSFSCMQWKTLVRALAGDLPGEVRSAWSDQLDATYADDSKSISALSKQEVSDLADAMRTLGSQKAGKVVLSWMSTHSKPR